MNVRELMERLAKCDPECEVALSIDHSQGESAVAEISDVCDYKVGPIFLEGVDKSEKLETKPACLVTTADSVLNGVPYFRFAPY